MNNFTCNINEIIYELAEKYGVNKDKLIPITGGYQNLVFEITQNNTPSIFRISDSTNRSEEKIIAELEWCCYLYNHGVSISRPLTSPNGNLIEVAESNDIRMIAVLFERAPGRKMSYPEYFNSVDVFRELGKITGKIHRLSKTYTPLSSKRNNWTENYYLKNFYTYIPQSEIDIRNSYIRLMNELALLEYSNDSYGLIHGDINVGNFHIFNGEITLFDFDECQYSWFAEDIAIQLYYTVYPFGDDSIADRQRMADKFMTHFMSGYYSENNIDDYWIKQIPKFLKLRELIVHVGIYKKWDLNNLNQWQLDYYYQSANRIKNGNTIVDYTDVWNRKAKETNGA